MSRFLVPLLAALATGSALAQNVAMVNDKPITKASIDQFVQQLGQPDTPELRNRIKDQLIEREVFLQEAQKRGIPERADVKFQLDFVRKTAIVQNWLWVSQYAMTMLSSQSISRASTRRGMLATDPGPRSGRPSPWPG